MNDKAEIEAFIKQHGKPAAGVEPYGYYYQVYCNTTTKFGLPAAQYLERVAETGVQNDIKGNAARAAARECRESAEEERHYKAEWRANLALLISGAATLIALTALFAD